MRKLKPNEKIVKEYDLFYLIEVTCNNGTKYRITLDKWTSTDKAKVSQLGFHKNSIIFREVNR